MGNFMSNAYSILGITTIYGSILTKLPEKVETTKGEIAILKYLGMFKSGEKLVFKISSKGVDKDGKVSFS